MKKKNVLIIAFIIIFVLIFTVIFFLNFHKIKKNNVTNDYSKQVREYTDYVYNENYHWIYNEEKEKTAHKFVNNFCEECGMFYNKTLFNIFGGDTVIYKNKNPYNINLKKYGSDINVIFYEPDFAKNKDNYINVDKDDFYNNYNVSYTYEDSYYRTKHGLLSGDIKPLDHMPKQLNKIDDNIRINTYTYVLDYDGNYIGYLTNSLSGVSRPIWYNGGYVTIDDVSAYLLAYGEVPPNSNYNPRNKNERRETIDVWGEYGRLNNAIFKILHDKFPYEPYFPDEENCIYIETDYGPVDEFYCADTKVLPYIKGNKIMRGTCRFVFTSNDTKEIEKRHVFYTYNHYNDFQEYLNYEGGYGKRFGNESAGNKYCRTPDDYKKTFNEPTAYPPTINKKKEDIIK